jgi:hypothetical protein
LQLTASSPANRFGIAEPVCSDDEWRSAREMDVIFAPLLGFDADGYRLGMGGGYYDRTLAFLAQRRHFRRPHFIGLAYAFQQISGVPHQKHDVKLEAVVTDEGTLSCRLRRTTGVKSCLDGCRADETPRDPNENQITPVAGILQTLVYTQPRLPRHGD